MKQVVLLTKVIFFYISSVSMFPDLEGQTGDKNKRALVMNNDVRLNCAGLSLFCVN